MFAHRSHAVCLSSLPGELVHVAHDLNGRGSHEDDVRHEVGSLDGLQCLEKKESISLSKDPVV